MEPAERFARNEAAKANSTLYRMLEIIEKELADLREELGDMPEADQNPGYFAQSLDNMSTDLDLARTEASRWVFMSQVTHAR